jgi:hypothetical protein
VKLGIAASVALLIGVVGIYGVIANAVAQHTREIGVRIALGAQIADRRKMFLRDGLWLTATGILIGISVAVVVSRVTSTFLFRRCVMSDRCTRLPIILPAATGAAVAVVSLALLGASCSRTSIPLAPSQLAAGSNAALNGTGDHGGHHATSQSTSEDKGYIDGWFDGHDVQPRPSVRRYRRADRGRWSEDGWPRQFRDLDLDLGHLGAAHRDRDSMSARIARFCLPFRMFPILGPRMVVVC